MYSLDEELTEEKLLGFLTNTQRESMAQIRSASSSIWNISNPRIIHNFTDHGIGHSERIINYMINLLQYNSGKIFNRDEIYLALAGAYLHDIGMQCDLTKYPEIKEIAERDYDAVFNINFKTKLSSEFSIEEQESIRFSHHLISAAWIKYASQTGKTPLGSAATKIPSNLLADLIDVCKYHSKLPINSCDIYALYDENIRKQLVAALLRFADELDIDTQHVDLNTVKNFNLDSKNAYIWWIHNRVIIRFVPTNILIIKIGLHPYDKNKIGHIIYSKFIAGFHSKNKATLSILKQNNIPIEISQSSEVVADDTLEKLPNEIVNEIIRMDSAMVSKKENLKFHSKSKRIADELKIWLRAINYEISDPMSFDNDFTDMIAVVDQGTFRQSILIRCLGREIRSLDIDEIDKTLGRSTPQGWLITQENIDDDTKRTASQYEWVEIFKISDLLSKIIWRQYFDALISEVIKSHIQEIYIDISCFKEPFNDSGVEMERENYSSLDEYIDSWLLEKGKNHISILGGFGSGKTWFCKHYAYKQLQRYLKDPMNERLPLLITLREFTKALKAQQLINDAFFEKYNLPFIGSGFEVFQELNRNGKLLLILDGFDEMALKTNDEIVVENFWELANLIDENSKVILTSRSEFFRWGKEAESILHGEGYERTKIVLPAPKFDVIHLDALNEEQIRKAITNWVFVRFKQLDIDQARLKADMIISHIHKDQNILEMAGRPVFIELLLGAMEDVSQNVLEHPAKVYLYATNNLLMKNIKDGRAFVSTSDKLLFLCELAWEMLKNNQWRIHYKRFPEKILMHFGNRIDSKIGLDNWDYELRGQSLLRRDGWGFYEFAHKSLAEFFVSLKFAAELGCIDDEFLAAYHRKEAIDERK